MKRDIDLGKQSRHMLPRFMERRWRERFPGRKFVRVSGVDIHYERRGKGRPVLLIHGLGDSLATWRPVADRLAFSGFDVISVDLKGCGRSEKPFSSDWSTPALVSEIAAFLRALKVKRAAVAGVSYGGTLALLLAAKHPALVGALLVCNAFAYREPINLPLDLRLARLPIVGRFAHWLMTRRGLEATFRAWNFSPGFAGLAERVSEHWRYLQLPGGRQAFMSLVSAIDERDVEEAARLYGDIEAPTLLLWGERDRWFPIEQAERLLEDIDGSTLQVVPGGYHLFVEENPDAFTRRAIPFIRKSMKAPARKAAAVKKSRTARRAARSG